MRRHLLRLVCMFTFLAWYTTPVFGAGYTREVLDELCATSFIQVQPGLYSRVFGCSSAGAVGEALTKSAISTLYLCRAAQWDSEGNVAPVSMVDGRPFWARGVNDGGDMIGSISGPYGGAPRVVSPDGSVTSLDDLTEAYDINDAGQALCCRQGRVGIRSNNGTFTDICDASRVRSRAESLHCFPGYVLWPSAGVQRTLRSS